jgi:hypothetical protein
VYIYIHVQLYPTTPTPPIPHPPPPKLTCPAPPPAPRPIMWGWGRGVGYRGGVGVVEECLIYICMYIHIYVYSMFAIPVWGLLGAYRAFGSQNLEKTRHFWLRGPSGSPRTSRKLDTSDFRLSRTLRNWTLLIFGSQER